MKRIKGSLLWAAAALAILLVAVVIGWHLRGPGGAAAAPVEHRSVGLKIEEVRKLAALVTLHVPITDVQTTKLNGWLGSTSVVVLVRGDVEIATDLEKARLVDVHDQDRRAVLELEQPQPRRPRVDFEKTRTYREDRSGLWAWMPGSAGEGAVHDEAMRVAQASVEQAARQPSLIDQARKQTEAVLTPFFAALGWKVEIRWK